MHSTDLEARLRRLERANLGLALALAATGVVLLTAAASPFTERKPGALRSCI